MGIQLKSWLKQNFFILACLWQKIAKFSHQIGFDPNKLTKTFCFYVLIDKFTFRMYLVRSVDKNATVKKCSNFIEIHKSRFLNLCFSSIEHSKYSFYTNTTCFILLRQQFWRNRAKEIQNRWKNDNSTVCVAT